MNKCSHTIGIEAALGKAPPPAQGDRGECMNKSSHTAKSLRKAAARQPAVRTPIERRPTVPPNSASSSAVFEPIPTTDSEPETITDSDEHDN